ncbi:MAG: glycoside hydrolase domain-containing protein [Candidatus Omnitrophota bacterium]
MNRSLLTFLIGIIFGIAVMLIISTGLQSCRQTQDSARQDKKASDSSSRDQPSAETPAPRPAFSKETGLFSSFEGEDPVRWRGNGISTDIVKADVCPDSHCLKVVYPAGKYPGLNARDLPGDWSGFDTLVFEAYNPNEDLVRFGLQIKDKPGGHSYPQRYEHYFAFRPGYNQFVFNITGIKTNNKKRVIDISQIIGLNIFAIDTKEPTTLYFDNIRLEKAAGSDIEGLQRFDFGTDQSETWPGFKKVSGSTRYQDDTGYGWSSTYGLDAKDRRYPDALLRDWVRGGQSFKVDVPNGDYAAYIMMEDPGFWEYYQNYPERRLIAEGKVVGEDIMPPEIFFRDHYYAHLNHEDLPGQDVFKNYIQKRFVWRRFTVNVDDRQLDIKCEPNSGYACTFNALIIAPLKQDNQVKNYLQTIDAQRRKAFESQYVEKVPAFAPLSDTVRAAHQEIGFVPFVKNIQEPMFPHEPPRAEQITPDIRVFAAKGESEPFLIGLHALTGGRTATVKMSALTGENGDTITADTISLRSVQYKLKLIQPNVYTVRGEMLREQQSAEFEKGINRFFWGTVDVPDDARPGDYRGIVRVCTADDQCSPAFNIVLTVMPFSLDEPGIPVGLFYSLPPQYNWYPERKSQKWTAIERHLYDMRQHGMNTLALGISPGVREIHDGGDVQLDFKFFDQFLHAYKHFGFNQPISGYGLISVFHDIRKRTEGNDQLFRSSIQNAFKQIEWHAQQLTGRTILIGLADEVSNTGGEGIDSVIKAAQAVKDAGLNATAYLNSTKDVEIFPHLSTATINNGMKIDKNLLKKAEKTDTDIWFYNIGQNRFSFGFYLWASGAKGRVQWHYQLPAVDPFFDLDGRESDYCASYPSESGPINTPWFEIVREGVDDLRYIRTLENLIAKAEKEAGAETEAVNDARRLLKAIRNDINMDIDQNNWPYAEYDAKRADIARMIGELIKKHGE